MASIRITIETDGTAFRDPDGRRSPAVETPFEVARILRTMADGYERHKSLPAPRDINGNECGKVEMLP